MADRDSLPGDEIVRIQYRGRASAGDGTHIAACRNGLRGFGMGVSRWRA